MPDPDRRLTELEIALTHAAAAVEELSGVVRAQADRIDALERAIARLARLAAEADADAGAPPAPDARPPHW